MIILAEKLDFFCARISNIRSKTLFWAQKQQSANLLSLNALCNMPAASR